MAEMPYTVACHLGIRARFHRSSLQLGRVPPARAGKSPPIIKESKKRENVSERFRECCFESLRRGASQCGHKIGEYGLLCVITRADG